MVAKVHAVMVKNLDRRVLSGDDAAQRKCTWGLTEKEPRKVAHLYQVSKCFVDDGRVMPVMAMFDGMTLTNGPTHRVLGALQPLR